MEGYYIKQSHGHYEAYTRGGQFICSGDTYRECETDALEFLNEKANNKCDTES